MSDVSSMLPFLALGCMMSSCSSSLALPFLFWGNVMAFLSKMNPFKAVGSAGKAVGRAGKKAVRAVGRIGKKGVRAVGRVGKKGVRAVSRVGRKGVRAVGRGFKKIGSVFRRRCFAPETLVKLQNGRSVMMKDLKLGDVLINGSIVDAVMKIKNDSDPYYQLGNIRVTGTHYVKYGGKYIQVRNVPGAKPTGKVDPVVMCLVTSDHKIPVGEYTFWDWEDNLIPTKHNVETIFKKLKTQRTVTVN